MISKSLLSSFLMLGFFSQASLATNIEEIEEVSPPQRTLNLGIMPYVIVQDIWREKINPYLPLNKTLGDDGYDSILTVSASFYCLVTGYWPDEKGVDRLPNVVINPPVSWKTRNPLGRFHRSHTPENIPPFLWRFLLKEAMSPLDTFWPYLKGTNVHMVYLLDYHIDDEGARAFALALQGTNVHTVYLEGNQIGDEGVCDFALALPGTNVHTVDLSENQIGDEGARAFGQALPGTNVHTVYLWHNQISPDTRQFLSETYPHITWTF